MKPRTQLLLGIIGLSALICSPAVAQQTNQMKKFFGDLPPYTGEDLTRPLNPVQKNEAAGNRQAQQSANDATPTPNGNFSQPDNQPQREILWEAPPANQKQNQP